MARESGTCKTDGAHARSEADRPLDLAERLARRLAARLRAGRALEDR